ncbi:MAG: hypothetical protein LAQ69_04355 [Acidobacteriia bacterium]|nr:hypothetical protein [Terriglobia bacterium]
MDRNQTAKGLAGKPLTGHRQVTDAYLLFWQLPTAACSHRWTARLQEWPGGIPKRQEIIAA